MKTLRELFMAVMHCRYPVDTTIKAVGHDWDTSRLDEVMLNAARDAAHIATGGAALIISAAQMHEALRFLAPDFDADEDQREADICIQYFPAHRSTDGDVVPSGLHCWLAEYPDEGCFPLTNTFDLVERMATKAPPSTPSAKWRVDGEADPHAGLYDGERAALTLGDLTDDELANGAFMNYDHRPSIEDMLLKKPDKHMPIVWMTAVKDRIRWLSRALERASEPSLTEDQRRTIQAVLHVAQAHVRTTGGMSDGSDQRAIDRAKALLVLPAKKDGGAS